MNKYIITEKRDDIIILSLNRPEKRNALHPDLVNRLSEVLDKVKLDQEIRGVILTGAGTAFCAGADLAYLKKISQFSENENIEDSRSLADLFFKLYSLPKITLAMVNGPALAGGCGLALCCDYVFAGQENARFGFTEVRIGFIAAIVMNFLIRRVTPTVASHLTLSGQILDARQALQKGMVHAVFPEKELRDQTLSFLDNLMEQNSFQVMIETKKLQQQLQELSLKDGLELSVQVNARSRQNTDCQYGLTNFLSKNKINWRSRSG